MSFRALECTFLGFKPKANPSEYHAIGNGVDRGNPEFVMSRSQLLCFAECPHKWLNAPEKKVTRAMEFGGLVDTLVTEPHRFADQYVLQPLTYVTERLVCPKCGSHSPTAKKCMKCKTDRELSPVTLDWEPRSEHCQNWIEEQSAAGKTVISRETLTNAERARDSLFASKNGYMRRVIENADTQVQILCEYSDEDAPGYDGTGLVVPFKALLDIVPWPESAESDLVIDLKVTRDARTEKWTRTVYADNLFVQAALYLDVLNAVTGLSYRRFAHFVIEDNEPFEATHHQLSNDFLMAGRAVYVKAMRRYCRCLASGEWPGYDATSIEVQPWMFRE